MSYKWERAEVVALEDVRRQPDEVEGVQIVKHPYRVEIWGKDNGYLIEFPVQHHNEVVEGLIELGYELYTYKDNQ